MMKKYGIILLTFCFIACGFSQNKNASSSPSLSDEPTETEVSEALKETLQESNETSESVLKKEVRRNPNALFSKKEARSLKKVSSKLKKAGKNDELDAFSDQLGSALTQIVSSAADLVQKQIESLTFVDAYRILKSGNSAATDYLKNQSSGTIHSSLDPVVQNTLESTGVMDEWNKLSEEYEKISGKPMPIDLVSSISSGVIDNMFQNMAQEEARIRVNAYLWKSVIMKEVFKRQIR